MRGMELMKKEAAIKLIKEAGRLAKENDCKLHIRVSWSEIRPFKTVKGAVTRIERYNRYHLWDGCCYIYFIGKKNGKEYKSAKIAGMK